MRTLLILIVAFTYTTINIAQTTQSAIFTTGDVISVSIGADLELYHEHIVKKGHTLYSLSKAYKVEQSTLQALNQISDGQSISLNQSLRIPLGNRNFYRGATISQFNDSHFIPIVYTAKAKETLYRISKIYFGQSVDDMVTRNGLTTTNIALGQQLTVGWLPLQKIAPLKENIEKEQDYANDQHNITPSLGGTPVVLDQQVALGDSATMDTIQEIVIPPNFKRELLGSIDYEESLQTISKSDIAHWDKSIHDNGSVFALHNEAVLNSYIYVYNPLVKRQQRVKVIGRIPYGTYTNDVTLLLSPRAAKHLGGIDRRFKVKVEYLIKK